MSSFKKKAMLSLVVMGAASALMSCSSWTSSETSTRNPFWNDTSSVESSQKTPSTSETNPNAILDGYFEYYKLENQEAYSVKLNQSAEFPSVITIPSSFRELPVVSIRTFAFSECTTVTTVILPNSIQSIGDFAFSWASSLDTIVLPNSLTSIGSFSFWGCNSLTSINIPTSVTKIGDAAFAACGLEEVTIPHGVTRIEKSTFLGCPITSIVIPNSVVSIDDSAFAGTRLETVTFETGTLLKHIGAYAFWGCNSLTSIVIPNGVEFIGESAFRDCELLTIYCEAETQPTGWNFNWNNSNRPVYWKNQWSLVNGVPTPKESK